MAPVITHGPQGFGSAEMMGEGATTPLGMTPRSPEKGVWGSMSFPKKAMAILFVPMALSVIVIFADIPGMPGASKRPVATATTTTAANTRPPEPTPTSPPTAATSVGVTASTVQPNPSVGAKGPIPPATGAAGALASAIPSTAGGIDAPPADPDDPIAQRAKVLRQDPIATQGARTLQREAADAVAAGAWDRAAKLYEKLAAQHPDQPAFAEAAAITRAKAAADRR
jgi:hypothetical protein